MSYYIDITLLPDTEISLGFIWQKVFQQVHIAFAENKTSEGNSAIAVSFPHYTLTGDKNTEFPLGNKLRIFAPSEALLEQLAITNWLKRLSDHTHITSIKSVPEKVSEFVCVKRKQCKTNLSRLARRRAKRKSESFEQALQYYASFNDEETKLPFINVNSLSKNEQFRLFISQTHVNEEVSGEFTCYGMSKETATVPWF
ncbi:type I-F CRISPR-associated endoribonuclease Cas6/Csy4 [Psychromonas antarctica]|uniref:type I-F CRISPR-associated endoribonuclease Cas6/Csy4 n=1 Tax=Psychromonas antarctica TaxID=67573 RepID=UPI001EE82D1C|nr:type I-F CRISPR-associated endoribonuclease Cas6/Csy4 [Psychromonas antarctica]MCG6202243.1 type I-F CRISPR-associated endoribonuclease Cas6/Csy4 [Psychromonas antarctica]